MVKGRVDPAARLADKPKAQVPVEPEADEPEIVETVIPGAEDLEDQEVPPKPVKQQKGARAPAPAPVAPQATIFDEAQEAEPEGLDPESLSMLSFLLKRDPELSDKMAQLILEHYGRNQEMDASVGGTGGADFFSPAPEAEAPVGASPAIPPEFATRVERLEQSYAQDALNRELAETVKEYETLRQQFPILPDLNEKEILQIALDKGALPLSDAMTLWAMQQMRQGDGTPADRIIAATMAKSPGRNLPSPEGKGGVPPSGEVKPPESLKEARGMAKDRIRNLFGAGPG